MRLFGRKNDDDAVDAPARLPGTDFPPPAPAQPPRLEVVPLGAYEIPTELTISREDGTRIRFVEDRAGAKEVTATLKLHKKELQLLKRQAAAEMQQVRGDYRLDNSRRSRTRGSGSLARTFRTFEQISRDSARANHGRTIDALDDRKAAIEMQIHYIDRVLLDLERFVLTLPEDPKPTGKRQGPRVCDACGHTAKASDKFCPECGSALA